MLYALRVLRRSGLNTSDLVCVYTSLIRSVVEYASPVWAALPTYLSDLIESIQVKSLRIIYPGLSYDDALQKAGLARLSARRDSACKKLVTISRKGGPLKNILPVPQLPPTHNSALRSGVGDRPHIGRTKRFNDFVTMKFQM